MQTITTPAGVYTPPATALIQKVQLRIFESCPSATLCLMQYDRALPVIAVELFEGGNPYKVPENAAVNIRMVKPDKTTVYNPALGVSSDRKTTYIGITPQMTACFGSCAATLEIALNDGVLGTGLLRLNIEKNPVSEDAVESSDEYLSLQEIVNKVQTYADQASTAAELAMNSVQAVVSVNAQTFTKEQKAQARANIGAAGTADLTSHNTSTGSHTDLRAELKALSDRINAALDSDDTTLDELSEIVAYIKSNKSLIDAITISKVNVTDIVNNLVTNVTNKPLSAAQGVELKALIDAVEETAKGLDITEFKELSDEQRTAARTNIAAVSYEADQGLNDFARYNARTNIKAVSYEQAPQTELTEEEKAQARANIGAASTADLTAATEKAVTYDSTQTLTTGQQAAARENIGAAPTSHVDNSGNYGKATASMYGHVLLVNNVDKDSAGDGRAVTPYALWKETSNRVSVDAQELTEAQKAQARENIGAAAVGEGGGWVQPDWDSAEGVDGHIKNRTHWKDWEYVEVVPIKDITVMSSTVPNATDTTTGAYADIVEGSKVRVYWDGTWYDRTAFVSGNAVYIGNHRILSSTGANTGEPFLLKKVSADRMTIYPEAPLAGAQVVFDYGLKLGEPVYHKLDNSYLDLDWIPKLENRSIAYSGKLIADEMDGELLKFTMPEEFELENGVSYTVRLGSNIANNIKCFYAQVGVQQRYYLGNAHLIDSQYTDTGEPFCLCETETETVAVRIILAEKPDGYELGVTEMNLTIVREGKVPQMPPVYLPDVAVRATGQRLTEEQKAQARANIGAAAIGEGGGGGGAQPDWDAAEGEPGHVKNRTHWVDSSRVEILPETTVPLSEGAGGFVVNPKQLLDAGKTYVIGWNGVEYSCVAVAVEEEDANGVMLGNIGLMTGTGDTGEPFVLISTTDPTMGETVRSTVFVDITGSSTEVSVSITGDGEIVHKLPGKFLPDGVPYVGKGEPVELLPATEAQATDDGFFITSPINGVEVGKTYIVNYNGTDYKGIAKDASAFASNSAMLGNSSVLGFGEDSGEPFFFVVFPPERLESDGFSAMIAAVDGASSVTLSISLLPEKLNKIDPRLLPDDVTKDFLIVRSVDGMLTATHTGADIYSAVGIDRKLCFFDFYGKPLPAVIIDDPGILRFETIYFADTELHSIYVVVEEDGTISDWGETTVNL